MLYIIKRTSLRFFYQILGKSLIVLPNILELPLVPLSILCLPVWCLTVCNGVTLVLLPKSGNVFWSLLMSRLRSCLALARETLFVLVIRLSPELRKLLVVKFKLLIRFIELTPLARGDYLLVLTSLGVYSRMDILFFKMWL